MGAGFRVFLHEPKSQPSFFSKSAIRLHPGYVYTVSMKSVKNVMETEFLGRCTNGVPSILKTDDDDYVQQECIMECLLQRVWNKCRCLFSGFSATDKLAKYFGKKKKEDVISCTRDLSNIKCMMATWSDTNYKYDDKTCPKCIKKCVDKTYEATITAKKFSSQFIQTIYPDFKEDAEYIRRTLIMAEFQFEEMVELTITESPMFTSRDVFLYIGNTAILFWGASTITFYEIIHQIAYSFTSFLSENWRRRKQKKINVIRKLKNEGAIGHRSLRGKPVTSPIRQFRRLWVRLVGVRVITAKHAEPRQRNKLTRNCSHVDFTRSSIHVWKSSRWCLLKAADQFRVLNSQCNQGTRCSDMGHCRRNTMAVVPREPLGAGTIGEERRCSEVRRMRRNTMAVVPREPFGARKICTRPDTSTGAL